MKNRIFERAILEYAKKKGINITLLRHYIIDTRLIEILRIYDQLKIKSRRGVGRSYGY